MDENKPGSNAFAQQAARFEQHRREGNAFYYEQVAKQRMATATPAQHPALRARGVSDPPSPSRVSDITTMSPFIRAATKGDSPELNLVPASASDAVPTQRGYIEDRREQMVHDASGGGQERVPVFYPTPKMIPSQNFASDALAPRKSQQKQVTIQEPAKESVESKSPKKKFRELFGLAKTGRTTSSPSASSLHSFASGERDNTIPPKAAALLGQSPSSGNLARSPSKKNKKGIFSGRRLDLSDILTSRKNHSQDDILEEPPHTATTVTSDGTLTKTPQTSCSDPAHASFYRQQGYGQYTTPNRHSDQGQITPKESGQHVLHHSLSLHSLAKTIPPTPLPKDTPPHEKEQKAAAATSQLEQEALSKVDITPSAATAPATDPAKPSMTPSQLRRFVRREQAQLIAQRSIYSLRASVIPDIDGAGSIEELQARHQDQGLGIRVPALRPESLYHQKAGMVFYPNSKYLYSPSNYGDQFNAPGSVAAESPCPTPPNYGQYTTDAHGVDASSESAQQSSESGESVPIVYPDLASDPSMSMLLQNTPDRPRASSIATSSIYNRHLAVDEETGLPVHGRTHSRDHSMMTRASQELNIFSSPIQSGMHLSLGTFTNPSAAPSPLQPLECLPSTVYTTPSRKLTAERAEEIDATPRQVTNTVALGSAATLQEILEKLGELGEVVGGLQRRLEEVELRLSVGEVYGNEFRRSVRSTTGNGPASRSS